MDSEGNEKLAGICYGWTNKCVTMLWWRICIKRPQLEEGRRGADNSLIIHVSGVEVNAL